MNVRKFLAFVVATAAVFFGYISSGQGGATIAEAQNVIINCQTSPAPTPTPSPGAFVPVNCAALGGSGGPTGSVTAAAANGTLAQAIQGIRGGVAVPVTGSGGSQTSVAS